MEDKQVKQSSESLESRLSRTLYEIRELEVINHELSYLHAKSKVYTRHGAGNVFFLSDRPCVVGQFRRKLDDAKKELAQLRKQNQKDFNS